MDTIQNTLSKLLSQAQSPESLIALVFTGIFANSVVSSAQGQYLFGSGSHAYIIGFVTIYAAFSLAAKFGSFLAELIWDVGCFALERLGII